MLELKNTMQELSTGSDLIMNALSSLVKSSETVRESSNHMTKKIGVIKSSLEHISVISNNTNLRISF